MMCVHSRARAHTVVSTAVYMHNSGATNASSHVGERNIKKRAEHKAMGRCRREGRRKGEREAARETRWPKEEARSVGRKKRDAVGTKGETDKGEREETVCEEHREK